MTAMLIPIATTMVTLVHANMDLRVMDSIVLRSINIDNCHSDANCTNNHGSFSCVCEIGYSGNGVDSYIDIDEFSSGTHMCSDHAICTNTIGIMTVIVSSVTEVTEEHALTLTSVPKFSQLLS